MRFAFPSILLLLSGNCYSQISHPNAHAHNDYEHSRPLFAALESGFRSIEADIHLIDGVLYVSHSRPKTGKVPTLQGLYLGPLDSLLRVNALQGSNMPLTMLIDIKTDATRTLQKLIQVLGQYPRLYQPGAVALPVRFVISGNRDYQQILSIPGLFIDGRPGDLGKGYSADKMPIISDHFGNWMQWNGKGMPSASEIHKINTLAKRVHDEGKKLRLWAIPDNEVAWSLLLDAGVDLINTDRLEELSMFLNGKQERK